MKRLILIILAAVLFAGGLWIGAGFLPTGHWLASSAPTNERVVALTFDDGPNPVYTPQILQILKNYGIKATFFMIGDNVARHPDVAKQVVADGNEVGNHSLKHSYTLPFLTSRQIRQDYHKTQRIIQEATGVTTQLYRAPHGRMSPWMGQTLKDEGAKIVRWQVSAADWKNTPPEVVVQRILKKVKPGSMILLHDGIDLNDKANRKAVVEALPGLIDGLKAQGYRFVTVSQLLDGSY